MNAKQIKPQPGKDRALNLSLITVEKADRPSLWDCLKKMLSSQDLTFETWERLEAKRSRASFMSIERGNF